MNEEATKNDSPQNQDVDLVKNNFIQQQSYENDHFQQKLGFSNVSTKTLSFRMVVR